MLPLQLTAREHRRIIKRGCSVSRERYFTLLCKFEQIDTVMDYYHNTFFSVSNICVPWLRRLTRVCSGNLGMAVRSNERKRLWTQTHDWQSSEVVDAHCRWSAPWTLLKTSSPPSTSTTVTSICQTSGKVRCRSVRMPWLSKVYSAFLTRTIVQVESTLYEVLLTAHYLGLMIKNYSVWVTPNSTTAREFSNLMFFKQGFCNSRKEKRKGRKKERKRRGFSKILLIESSTVIEPEWCVVWSTLYWPFDPGLWVVFTRTIVESKVYSYVFGPYPSDPPTPFLPHKILKYVHVDCHGNSCLSRYDGQCLHIETSRTVDFLCYRFETKPNGVQEELLPQSVWDHDEEARWCGTCSSRFQQINFVHFECLHSGVFYSFRSNMFRWWTTYWSTFALTLTTEAAWKDTSESEAKLFVRRSDIDKRMESGFDFSFQNAWCDSTVFRYPGQTFGHMIQIYLNSDEFDKAW